MSIRKLILGLCLVMLSSFGYAQIDSVGVTLLKIKACGDDSLKIIYADQIPKLLEQTGFGSQQKSSPVKFLGYKYCSNAEAELFAWSVPLTTGLAYYNWFRFKEDGKVYLLRTLPGENPAVPSCFFYDLLAFKADKREYFALLGWSQEKESNRKYVWIARFDNGGKVNFKTRLIGQGKNRTASLVFEYAKEGSMGLKHDKNGKRIIFDHLIPVEKKYEGFHMFYGPDGSYDALVLKKGRWELVEDVKRGK